MAGNGPEQSGELIFIKLGGSLITDKSAPYTAELEVMQRLGAEMHAARLRCGLSLLVGHGSGSFGHVSASRYRTHEGVVDDRSWEGFNKVRADAARLNALVCQSLAGAGEPAAPIQPSSACVARAGRILRWCIDPIEALLGAGLVPVVYGDVCLDQSQGFCIASTEEIFRYLAGVLRPQRIILVGKVDGVLDAAGTVIPSITPDNFPDLRASLHPSDGLADVTGGMLHKVERSLEVGVRTEIINGMTPGLLERALLDERVVGTVIEGTVPTAATSR